jgi:putative transposase
MHLANTLPKIRVYAFVCHYRSSFPLCGGLEPLFIRYPDCLKKHDIRISMDGCGRAIDNVFVVKYEQVYLHVYDDENSLWKGLSEYFRFYNREKLHQSPGYRPSRDVFL